MSSGSDDAGVLSPRGPSCGSLFRAGADGGFDSSVLIRTAAVGLCHSDLHYIDGLYAFDAPAILGHEAAGIVEKVGSEVTGLKAGDHVITCLSVFCGHCAYCTTGRPYNCDHQDETRRPATAERTSTPPPVPGTESMSE